MTQFIQVNGVPAPITRQGRVENVSFTAGAPGATATRISDGVKAVVICPDEDCYYKVGDSGVTVSASDGSLIYAGSYYFTVVSPGEYLAFIGKVSSGVVNITECAAWD